MKTKTGLIAFLTLVCGFVIVWACAAQPGAKQADAEITITVRLPADAVLEIDGHKTDSAGALRTFQTPPLPAAKEYTYTLKAVSKGKEVTREIKIAHGAENSFDLRAEFESTASKAGGTRPGAAQPKSAADIPPAITTPDKVETRLGTLEFKDGAPSKETVEKVYDNLDLMHASEAFLNAFRGASLVAARKGFMLQGQTTTRSSFSRS